ncbi:MAG: hypothetical protein K2X59_10645 [Sphingomonas sp.]|nr:hypothetical protein [Sphingomonas sp.]
MSTDAVGRRRISSMQSPFNIWLSGSGGRAAPRARGGALRVRFAGASISPI